ncbi:hypothetical protein [Brevundimonas sp.]|uniref:hypothetical protein n=1 Tax=Brevundimonas sp. TaxID=1871086 RepID=UPI0035AEA50D
MTRAARAKTDNRAKIDLACLRGLAALGAPRDARSRLIVQAPGAFLTEAVEEVLGSSETRTASFDRHGVRDPDLASGHDLIVTSGVLGAGTIADTARRLGAFVEALAPGGCLAAAIETYATAGANGAEEVVLFPDLGALGLLGPDVEVRTPLPPAAWLALLSSAGLKVKATAGYGEEPLADEVLDRHAPRLAAFDGREIATGRLLVVAEKPGAPT